MVFSWPAVSRKNFGLNSLNWPTQRIASVDGGFRRTVQKTFAVFFFFFFPFLFVYHGFYGLLRQVGWISIQNLLFIFPETIPLDRLKSPCSPLNPLISLKLSPKREMGKGPCTKWLCDCRAKEENRLQAGNSGHSHDAFEPALKPLWNQSRLLALKGRGMTTK